MPKISGIHVTTTGAQSPPQMVKSNLNHFSFLITYHSQDIHSFFCWTVSCELLAKTTVILSFWNIQAFVCALLVTHAGSCLKLQDCSMCLFFLVLPLSRGLRALFNGLMVLAWRFWGMNTWPSDLPFSHHCPTCHVYSIVLDEFFLFWTIQQTSLLLNPMSFVYISPMPLPCLYLSLRLLIQLTTKD